MSEDKENFDNIFGGVKFLGGMFSTSPYLGAFFTALLLGIWIWYAIVKKKMKWREAVKKAADSLSAVSGESKAHNDNTNAGDDWENK